MRVFKALLRGFRDLADGSGTAMLDITDSHYPDNTKQFKQRWGYWVDAEDYEALMEGKTFAMPARYVDFFKTIRTVCEDAIIEAEGQKLTEKEGEEDADNM